MEPLAIIGGRLRSMLAGFIAQLPQLTLAALAVVATWLVARSGKALAKRLGRRSGMRPELIQLIGQLAAMAIWLVGLLVAATIAIPDMTPSSLIAGIGLGSVAIGFAFKDVFENFLAGILILWREPMRIGDFIDCEGIEGRVEKISVRDSSIRRTTGELVVVPNSVLFKNPVQVLTNRKIRRVTVMLGIGYAEDADRAREVVERAVQACGTVSREQPVRIFARAFGQSSLDFEVTWWAGSLPVEIRRSRDEVVRAVKRALDEAGIEIPFPYRTLTFKDPVPLAMDDRPDGRARPRFEAPRAS